jgi:hypothetical protein
MVVCIAGLPIETPGTCRPCGFRSVAISLSEKDQVSGTGIIMPQKNALDNYFETFYFLLTLGPGWPPNTMFSSGI